MIKVIVLKNVCSGSTLPEHGIELLNEIKNNIRSDKIYLSLEDFGPMSCSFMNASFGTIIDNSSKKFLRKKIALINFRPSHAEYIKKYIENY